MKNPIYQVSLFVLLFFLYLMGLSFFWVFLISFFPTISLNEQMILNQTLSFLVPALLYLLVTKKNLREVLSIKPIKFYNIILVFFISIFIQPVMSFLGLLTSLFFENNVSAMLIENAGIPFFSTLFAVAIMPAICEEVMFRGIIYDQLKNTNAYTSCILTGLFFGLMHFDGQQFLYAFFMGCIFCFFVRTTGSIFTSMLSHFIINGTQIFFVYLQNTLYNVEQQTIVENTAVTLYDILIIGRMVLFVAPILFLLFFLFIRFNKGKVHFENDGSTFLQDITSLWNIPFLLILFLYSVLVILPLFFY